MSRVLHGSGFREQGARNAVTDCLIRAFGNLKLFCIARCLRIQSIRSFTITNMHAARNAFPWLGCKGADSIVILKWVLFYVNLQLQQPGWSQQDRKVLSWMSFAARAGLSFSQGIHGHGIWLAPSCVSHCRNAVQKFGTNYALLANHCLEKGYCLYGMVPKLHSYMHFRTDFDDSVKKKQEHTLNPALFDCSMSEDFVGRISRQSRRIPFRNIERGILGSYQVKARMAIKQFLKKMKQPNGATR